MEPLGLKWDRGGFGVEKSELADLMLGLRVYRDFDSYKEVGEFLISQMPPIKSSNLIDYVYNEVQSGRGKEGRRQSTTISNNIASRVESGVPLDFAVIALAHKNPDPLVCGGSKEPDLAELYFILHLTRIIRTIERFYEPGARFTILTEGELYKGFGLFDVSDDEIVNYINNIRSYTSEIIGEKIRFESLKNITDTSTTFRHNVEEITRRLEPQEYDNKIKSMANSLSVSQQEAGTNPEDLARRFVAIHNAKHISGENGGSAVYQYLQNTLGPNYIYTAVTTSEREEVLNIDTYPRPSDLPQHGIGVLVGGGQKLNTRKFSEIKEQASTHDLRTITVGGKPIGIMDFGKKRK